MASSEESLSDDDSSNATSNNNNCNNHTLVCRVQLWLDSRSNLRTIKESLADPDIQFLDLHVLESFLTAFRVVEIEEIMKTIGNLPQLERLDITCPYSVYDTINNNSSSSTPPALPVSAIQLAFTKDLTHLLLVNVKLCGSLNDFVSFARAAQQLSKLHVVVLAQVRLLKTTNDLQQQPQQPQQQYSALSNNNNNTNNNNSDDNDYYEISSSSSYSYLDPFLRSVSKISSLGHLLISGSDELGTLRPSTCARLLSGKENNNIRDLCLSQLSLDTEHLQALANANASSSPSSTNLTTNKNILRELDLQCHLTVEGAHALAKLLHNNSTLEELTLRLMTTKTTKKTASTANSTPRVSVAGAAALVVAAAAAADDDDDDDDDVSVAEENQGGILAGGDPQLRMEYQRNVVLAGAITRSRWLNNFELESDNLATPILLEPFHNMLQDNYSLESVRLKAKEQYCLEREITFYTRLNKMGRRHLFQCPHCSHCDESYVRMLDELNSTRDSDFDLSAYYYFCRSKPTLLVGKLLRGQQQQRNTSSTKNSTGNNKNTGGARTILGKRKRLFRAAKYNGVSYKD